jgi:dienelactone hydrolase
MLWRMRRTRAWLGLAAVVLCGCAGPARVSFPNATPSAPLAVAADAYRPAGPGPFPALVLLHGCEGMSENGRRWAQWLRGQGYFALVVDSWTPRGLKETCTFTVQEPPNTARLDDAFGALRYLQARGDIDPRRIGAIGWSNGGVFSIAVINGPSLERAKARGVAIPEPGYAVGIGVYPGGCDSLKGELVVRPLLVLIGDADDWTKAATCKEMVDAMRARGADASIELLPGAYHYFDFEGLARTTLPDVGNDNKPNGCCGATVAFDTAAYATARRRIAEFLGYHLRAK